MRRMAVALLSVQSVKKSGKPYQPPYKQSSPNSIRRYLSECDIDPDAEIEDVELSLTPEGVRTATEYPIYPFQIIEMNADGSGRISMRVPITEALKREIRSHAPEVRVLKPKRLW